MVTVIAALLLIIAAAVLSLATRPRRHPGTESTPWRATDLAGDREPLLLDDSVIATETRVVPGESAELPFGLEVVMQTRNAIQPVAFVLETDRNIGSGRAVQFNAGDYLLYRKTKQGVPPDHPNWFAFEWETPVFTANSPIIVSLSSKTPIALDGLYKVAYEWP